MAGRRRGITRAETASIKGMEQSMAATNGYKRLHGLTVEQQNAVDRLVAGDTDYGTGRHVALKRFHDRR